MRDRGMADEASWWRQEKARVGAASPTCAGLAVMLFGVESFRMNFPYRDARSWPFLASLLADALR